MGLFAVAAVDAVEDAAAANGEPVAEQLWLAQRDKPGAGILQRGVCALIGKPVHRHEFEAVKHGRVGEIEAEILFRLLNATGPANQIRYVVEA